MSQPNGVDRHSSTQAVDGVTAHRTTPWGWRPMVLTAVTREFYPNGVDKHCSTDMMPWYIVVLKRLTASKHTEQPRAVDDPWGWRPLPESSTPMGLTDTVAPMRLTAPRDCEQPHGVDTHGVDVVKVQCISPWGWQNTVNTMGRGTEKHVNPMGCGSQRVKGYSFWRLFEINGTHMRTVRNRSHATGLIHWESIPWRYPSFTSVYCSLYVWLWARFFQLLCTDSGQILLPTDFNHQINHII